MRDEDRLIDPETGLASPWHFEIILDFLFPISHRGVHLTLVLFGIDGESSAEGGPDPRLQTTELGSAIRQVTRSSDLAAPYGEDLFICLLTLCNVQGGLIFADRIRDAISAYTGMTGTTVSAAVASHRGEDEGTKEDMLRALEGALATARAQGGDRVEVPKEGWKR